MTVQPSFGQWLRQRRKALNLTQVDLAQRIGCATVTLRKIEADERRPSKQIAKLLAEHLHIPANEQAAFVEFARAEAAETPTRWGVGFHPPTNLPLQPTPLIGRDVDVSSIRKRLLQPEARLLTLIGPPGIGKTRLAQQIAEEALDEFADGVFLVILAPISDANLVTMTIATVLGVPDTGTRPPLERLKAFLRDKQILLLLDNFEQILAAAPDIAELLTAAPLLKILVTSRAPLRIRQERQIPIPPLALPSLASQPDVETIALTTAIMLFMERAQAVKPDFALTEANATTVAAICTRLDGLPLAIELISARVKLLPPAMLLERLSGRLLLQSDGLRDIEPRHRTLNNAIEWSYQLLRTDEQILFRRLGVFVGGWTLEAAEAVCSEKLNISILDGLASLLDKSLIKQATGFDGASRFMMLETIHEYALVRLTASGEIERLQQRHTGYFLQMAEQAEANNYGRDELAWNNRLEADWDNLRGALARSAHGETGMRLAGALGGFFNLRYRWNEGLEWLERILDSNPNAPVHLRTKVLRRLGGLIGAQHDPRTRAFCEQALMLARPANDYLNMAWALCYLGWDNLSNLDESVALLEEGLALFREIQDPLGLSWALFYRAYRALDQHDYPYVRLLTEELAIYAHEADDKTSLAHVSYLLGRLAWHQEHDLHQVKMHYETSLALHRELRHQDDINMTIGILADVELALGNIEVAQRLNEEALILHYESLPEHPRISFMFSGLAGVARARGQFERAARLLGAAQSAWVVRWSGLSRNQSL